jgi:catalase
LIDNLAVAISPVTREEIIERSISYLRNADADYGERLAKAVRTLRAKNRDADITVHTDTSQRPAQKI